MHTTIFRDVCRRPSHGTNRAELIGVENSKWQTVIRRRRRRRGVGASHHPASRQLQTGNRVAGSDKFGIFAPASGICLPDTSPEKCHRGHLPPVPNINRLATLIEEEEEEYICVIIGAKFHTGQWWQLPQEKETPHTERHTVRNWTRLQYFSLFHCFCAENYIPVPVP